MCFCIQEFFGVKLGDFCFNHEFNSRKLLGTKIFGTENPTASEKQLSLSFLEYFTPLQSNPFHHNYVIKKAPFPIPAFISSPSPPRAVPLQVDRYSFRVDPSKQTTPKILSIYTSLRNFSVRSGYHVVPAQYIQAVYLNFGRLGFRKKKRGERVFQSEPSNTFLVGANVPTQILVTTEVVPTRHLKISLHLYQMKDGVQKRNILFE